MATLYIPLTQGKIALIDEEDAGLIGERSWSLAARREKNLTRNYAQGFIGNRVVLMHRVIMGARKGQVVDHINLDGLDNRRCNLRIVTPSQNNQNQARRVTSSCGYKGVHKARNRWAARIHADGEAINLGNFLTPEDAARAYDNAARELFGEFGRFNFPLLGEHPALVCRHELSEGGGDQ